MVSNLSPCLHVCAPQPSKLEICLDCTKCIGDLLFTYNFILLNLYVWIKSMWNKLLWKVVCSLLPRSDQSLGLLSPCCLPGCFISRNKKNHTAKRRMAALWVNPLLGAEEPRISEHMVTIAHIMVFPEYNFRTICVKDEHLSLGLAFWIIVANGFAYDASLLLQWFKGTVRSSNLASCKTTGHYTSSSFSRITAIIHFWLKSDVFS